MCILCTNAQTSKHPTIRIYSEQIANDENESKRGVLGYFIIKLFSSSY